MARVHNFSAGPAALPTSVLAEIADEMMDYRGCGMSVLEMSHRSSMYQQIIDDAEATLCRLLSIPDNYRVLFLQGGATLQFAGIPMNLMCRGRAGYVVTGNFANKAYKEAAKYGEAEANCADMAISELKDYLENGNIAHSVNYPACSMGKARAASRIACLHANVPNMIGQITAILAKDNANVQRMTNESAGENAYTMFDTDEHLDSSTIEALKQIPSMYRVRVIK